MNKRFTFRKKDRKSRKSGRCEEETMSYNKVNNLIDRKVFPESDRQWLCSLNRNQLNTIFAMHFKVDAEEDAARDPHGRYARDGDTGHQVRKMQKMGIACRTCEA